jgi:hypothetical protein
MASRVALAQAADLEGTGRHARVPAPRGGRALDHETEALVERTAHVGGEEQDGIGAAPAQPRHRSLGQRTADALAPGLGSHAERADPAGGAERHAADRARRGARAAVVGHEDVPVRAAAWEGDQARDRRAECRAREQVGDRAGLVVARIAHRGNHGPPKLDHDARNRSAGGPGPAPRLRERIAVRVAPVVRVAVGGAAGVARFRSRVHAHGPLYDAVMSATLTDVYDLPQEHKDFRDTIRQIVDEKVRPRAAEIDATGEYPWDVRRLFADQDILALPFDIQYGGTGTGTLMLQIAVEEIAKACASSALILMIQELGTLPIARFGSDELKERLLPRCATGEWSPAFALSEPEAGSDPASMRTTAVRDGDDVGHQRRQELDHQHRDRRLLCRLRVTDRENRRMSAFVVEKDRPGSRWASSSTSSASRARRPARRPSRTSACRPRT